MSHDPVCDCSGVCDPPNTSCEMVTYACGCECSGIAKGRADEREKAAQRARAVIGIPCLGGYGDCVEEACVCARVIAAVRGES